MWDPRFESLVDKQIYFGTSSWKYPGWRGVFYFRNYRSEKSFQDNSLAEYAMLFPAVGVDHTYYDWPRPATFNRYFEQTPDSFRFCLKATERTTVAQFPSMKRYGRDASQRNPVFLDPVTFREHFLQPLRPYRERLAPVVFEFSQFRPGMVASGSQFLERLDAFFTALRDEADFRFAIELRNANWLQRPYFQLLEKHQVGHVFNSWTRMPPLQEQVRCARKYRLPFLVSRILLQPGVEYEESVQAYSPYRKIGHIHPDLRAGGAELVRWALEDKLPAYLFVNNRAEGCAPLTIAGILDVAFGDQNRLERGLNPSARNFSAAST